MGKVKRINIKVVAKFHSVCAFFLLLSYPDDCQILFFVLFLLFFAQEKSTKELEKWFHGFVLLAPMPSHFKVSTSCEESEFL
jgi:hypothetical protein